jgi:hypothetical protein
MKTARSKAGTYICILAGLAYFLIGVTFLLLPTDQQVGKTDSFLAGLLVDRTMLRINYFFWALAGVAGLGVVPLVSNLVREGHEELVDWIRNLGILGFMILCIDHFHVLGFDRFMVSAYNPSDSVGATALANVVPYLPLDRGSWQTGGFTGLWLFTVNLLAFRKGGIPRRLTYFGMTAGALSMLAVAAQYLKPILGEGTLMPIISVGAVIIGPIWFIGTGLHLRTAAAASGRRAGAEAS